MKPSCFFQIPRGETSRYVFVFYKQGNIYKVYKKVKLGSAPYKTLVINYVPEKYLIPYINNVVSVVY